MREPHQRAEDPKQLSAARISERVKSHFAAVDTLLGEIDRRRAAAEAQNQESGWRADDSQPAIGAICGAIRQLTRRVDAA